MHKQLRSRITMPMLFAAVLGFAIMHPVTAQPAVMLMHVHGLAYSADGTRLYVPSHHGLAVYHDGHWSKAPGPQHDYMGFSATRNRFYSSGHPAPESGMRNPFGLIRSGDGGNTWEKFGLEGESDFHVLATGYETNAVYVYNTQANSRMRERGIHFTLNDGFSWQRTDAKGLAGDIASFAVHPSDSRTVAAGTSSGVYLSKDAGATFESILIETQGLAVFFDLDGKRLWAASHSGQPRLTQIVLADRQKTEISLPTLGRDAVSYIAQNPKRPLEYAIATFERSVYLTKDGGKTWIQIADRGRSP